MRKTIDVIVYISYFKTPMFRIQNIGVSFLKHICFELDISWL